jgi:hypothetical protein
MEEAARVLSKDERLMLLRLLKKLEKGREAARHIHGPHTRQPGPSRHSEASRAFGTLLKILCIVGHDLAQPKAHC